MQAQNGKEKDLARFAAILENPEVRAELGRLFFRGDGGGYIPDVSPQLMRAHSNRFTLEVTVRDGESPRTPIGKVHGEDRTDIFETTKAIAASGFGAEAEYAIAQPLAYVPGHRVLFEEKVEGVQTNAARPGPFEVQGGTVRRRRPGRAEPADGSRAGAQAANTV